MSQTAFVCIGKGVPLVCMKGGVYQILTLKENVDFEISVNDILWDKNGDVGAFKLALSKGIKVNHKDYDITSSKTKSDTVAFFYHEVYLKAYIHDNELKSAERTVLCDYLNKKAEVGKFLYGESKNAPVHYLIRDGRNH